MEDVASRLDDFEQEVDSKLSGLDEQLQELKNVIAASADDTLRVCLLLEELVTVGAIPPIPWALGTEMVELHHAEYAKKAGEVAGSGESLDERIARLKGRIFLHRMDFRDKCKELRKAAMLSP